MSKQLLLVEVSADRGRQKMPTLLLLGEAHRLLCKEKKREEGQPPGPPAAHRRAETK
jgi:hypothetical protein